MCGFVVFNGASGVARATGRGWRTSLHRTCGFVVFNGASVVSVASLYRQNSILPDVPQYDGSGGGIRRYIETGDLDPSMR